MNSDSTQQHHSSQVINVHLFLCPPLFKALILVITGGRKNKSIPTYCFYYFIHLRCLCTNNIVFRSPLEYVFEYKSNY